VRDAADRQLDWIRDAAGARFDELELQMTAFPAQVTDDPQSRTEDLGKAFGIDPSEVLESPHILLGSIARICELLEERRARWGVSYWVVAAAAIDQFAPVVERMAGR
jgi:hypothetical protein